MLQLHHQFSNRTLIEILNKYGFCASYDKLRISFTSAAISEMEHANGKFIPLVIIHLHNGGCLIQEGDDNIDINAETIDGKNTYHSMARVIFQDQCARRIVCNHSN